MALRRTDVSDHAVNHDGNDARTTYELRRLGNGSEQDDAVRRAAVWGTALRPHRPAVSGESSGPRRLPRGARPPPTNAGATEASGPGAADRERGAIVRSAAVKHYTVKQLLALLPI